MPSRQLYDTASLPTSATSPGRSSAHSSKGLILGLAVGGGAGVLVIIVACFCFLYYRFKASRTSPFEVSPVKLKKFSYRELKHATDNFSATQRLGQGGFGVVYKGTLKSGKEVAVKKLDTSSLQGEREFQNEVSVIGRVNSPHIVSLLGFCADGKKRLLVYDYMENGSLQEALFDEMYAASLDWETRFKIILDTARGLAFLHYKCDPPIIHGDVKPSNILLDKHFAARIADFGLARLKSEDTGPVRSEQVDRESMERDRIRFERIERDRARRAMRRKSEAEKKKKRELEARTRPNSVAVTEEVASPTSTALSNGVDVQNSCVIMEGSPVLSSSTGFTLDSPGLMFESPVKMLDYATSVDGSPTPASKNIGYVHLDSPLLGDVGAGRNQRNGVPSFQPPKPRDTTLETKFRHSPNSDDGEFLFAQTRFDAQSDTGESAVEEIHNGETAAAGTVKDSISAEESPLQEGRESGSSKGKEAAPEVPKEEAEVENWSTISPSEGYRDDASVGSGMEVNLAGSTTGKERRSWNRDWWWRQDISGDLTIKDFINWTPRAASSGSRREKSPQKDWGVATQHEKGEDSSGSLKEKKRKELRRDHSMSSEGWGEFSGELANKKREAKREKEKFTMREWWREEHSGELNSTKKGASKSGKRGSKRDWWSGELSKSRDLKASTPKSSPLVKMGGGKSKSREWWREEHSGELPNTPRSNSSRASRDLSREMKRDGRREKSRSRDWLYGDLQGSKGVGSTPSMRGTICYVAPEYGGGGILSEKSDVYSFGVLMLVIISGRRPLQVMASPIIEFERANLISWARHLAHSGNVIDLVDGMLQGQFSKEQAILCITVALLCLQRLPAVRPTMGEVVKILLGEVDVPALPSGFSPSPNYFTSRSRPSTDTGASEVPLLA